MVCLSGKGCSHLLIAVLCRCSGMDVLWPLYYSIVGSLYDLFTCTELVFSLYDLFTCTELVFSLLMK